MPGTGESIRDGGEPGGKTPSMADDDDFGTGPIEDPDGYAVATAAGELSSIEWGAKVLKVVAGIAAFLWLAALVTIFWNQWRMSSGISYPTGITTGAMDNDRVLQTLATTLASTWGYALVAVIAYLGSMLLHGQRMRLLIAAMGDD